MRWARYKTTRGGCRLAIQGATGLHDLGDCYDRFRAEGGAVVRGLRAVLQASSLRQFLCLRGTGPFLAALRRYEQDGVAQSEEAVTWCAPLHDPGRIIGIGLNYRSHAQETGQPLPAYPPLFAKWANSINGPYDPIFIPPRTAALDYEVELGVVIGTRARDLSRDEALSCVFGYTIINDVSARDLQFQTSQWLAGKVGDGFAPMGPVVAQKEDVPSFEDLILETWVNGERRQCGQASDMVYGVAELVSYLSHLVTLEPGDVIATGTPSGVGMGMNPPRYLKGGDVVRMSITGLGAIENRILAP